VIPCDEIENTLPIRRHRVPWNPEQHLTADHDWMGHGIGVNPQDEDQLLTAWHRHGDDLWHRLGNHMVQAAGQRVMLSLGHAHDAVFPRSVLVFDAHQDDAAVRVGEGGDRLGNIRAGPLLLGLEGNRL
jgi:hypothetical protein